MKSQVQARLTDVIIDEKFVNVIITRKSKDKFFPLCFVGFSQSIDSIRSQGIEKTDKVKINFTARSKKYEDRNGKERYSTSLIIDNIELIEKNASTQTEVIFIDKNTGEIIDADNNNNNSPLQHNEG
tara:strand:- start:140 stop:520 length:381 start_codon:yes stop_codon:yes gene_type:complete